MLTKFVRAFKKFKRANIQIIDHERIETDVYKITSGIYVLVNERRNKVFIYDSYEDYLTELKFYDNDIGKGIKSLREVYDYDICFY